MDAAQKRAMSFFDKQIAEAKKRAEQAKAEQAEFERMKRELISIANVYPLRREKHEAGIVTGKGVQGSMKKVGALFNDIRRT